MVAAAAQTGIDEAKLVVIGSILAVCLVLYVIPRTAPVGALLLTAYLGGATAANLLFNQPVPLIFFPVVFGVLVWLGLYLRDDRLRVLIAPGR